jgi:hypothetical protein
MANDYPAPILRPISPLSPAPPRNTEITEFLPEVLITIWRDNRRFRSRGFGNRVEYNRLMKE